MEWERARGGSGEQGGREKLRVGEMAEAMEGEEVKRQRRGIREKGERERKLQWRERRRECERGVE